MQRWTEEELGLALGLYNKLRRNNIAINAGNIWVTQLSNYLNRTPASIVMRLQNFTSLDDDNPSKGLTNAGEQCIKFWDNNKRDQDKWLTNFELLINNDTKKDNQIDSNDINKIIIQLSLNSKNEKNADEIYDLFSLLPVIFEFSHNEKFNLEQLYDMAYKIRKIPDVIVKLLPEAIKKVMDKEEALRIINFMQIFDNRINNYVQELKGNNHKTVE